MLFNNKIYVIFLVINANVIFDLKYLYFCFVFSIVRVAFVFFKVLYCISLLFCFVIRNDSVCSRINLSSFKGNVSLSKESLCFTLILLLHRRICLVSYQTSRESGGFEVLVISLYSFLSMKQIKQASPFLDP